VIRWLAAAIAWLVFSAKRWLEGRAGPDPLPIRAMPRFSLRVSGELLEADSFGGIIQQMRERWHSDADVIAAALVVNREPRGGELEIPDRECPAPSRGLP
jgi:hypothetical protein